MVYRQTYSWWRFFARNFFFLVEIYISHTQADLAVRPGIAGNQDRLKNIKPRQKVWSKKPLITLNGYQGLFCVYNVYI